ncbi:hypothetical protein [Bifidobacterium phasiani]|uniref:Secreted protein n=1 Tax=Bifidobacterium phasiani TaxID=2834431 RepID=A0ABS6WB98_9BIFI|nr:hypothetical protein [Bifidobacterium phasiani]MBW3083012.1 hypothetical protein [Bifidobacterium phasiani]
MANTQGSSSGSSHGKLIAVVVAAAVVIVLAVLSAFVWPGWAVRSDGGDPQQNTQQEQEGQRETTPSIEPVALPDDASELLKAMPDTVLDFARTAAGASGSWTTSNPLEEYTLTYSTGDAAQDVTLIVAQWATADEARTQYDALAGALTGDELGSGEVKVSGETTGNYVARVDASDDAKAVAVWQNDTAVFQATGARESVEDFYMEFPL